MNDSSGTSDRRTKITLLTASAALLFAELAVVRWSGSELVNLAYFKNLVLIGAFLGAGLGMLAGDRRPRLVWLAPVFSLLCVLLLLGANRFGLTGRMALGDLAEFQFGLETASSLAQSLQFLTFFVILFLVSVALFAGFGALVGREMVRVPALPGYLLNLTGSLLGAVAFAACSLAELPPWVWFVLAAVPFGLSVLPGWRGVAVAAGMACIGAPVALLGTPGAWSPYNRISLTQEELHGRESIKVWTANVDGAYFMRALDLRPPIPDIPLLRSANVHYNLPYLLVQPKTVLVLGSGMGNDVAAALRWDVTSVDAVEIDPVIVRAGRTHHPEKPYDSPKVRLFVDDARSFLTRTDGKYDLIVLGLLDSHTLLSQLPALRLDNYVYTVESLQAMRRHLTSQGVIALSFAVPVERMWLGLKLDSLVVAALGEAPLAFAPMYDASFLFLCGPGIHAPGLQGAATAPALKSYKVDRAALAREVDKDDVGQVEVPTDDWPHLYLRLRGISTGHLVLFVLLLPLAFAAAQPVVRVSERPDMHFFLLGAGFLLVETKGIADLGLLFGGTWWTITAVITAMLAMGLLSTALVMVRPPERRWPYYAGLFVALALLFVIRPADLLELPLPLAQTLGSLEVALPVFFSGVIFAVSFRRAVNPAHALGSNLIGAVLGGFMEYASLAWGIRVLTLIAMILYALSAVALKSTRDADAASA